MRRLFAFMLLFSILVAPSRLHAQAPAPAQPAPTPPVVRGQTTVASGGMLCLSASVAEPRTHAVWRQMAGPRAFYTTFEQGVETGVVLFSPNPPDGSYQFALEKIDRPFFGRTPEMPLATVAVTVGPITDPVIGTHSPTPVPVPNQPAPVQPPAAAPLAPIPQHMPPQRGPVPATSGQGHVSLPGGSTVTWEIRRSSP